MLNQTSAEPDQAQESTIPLCVPEIRGNEWEYIKECLDTNWVSSAGSYVDEFERRVADYTGSPHAVATTNGTAALHTCLVLSEVEEGDEVIIPPLTFIAPANAIRYIDAYPLFLDVDPEYGQLDPKAVQRFLEEDCDLNGKFPVNKHTQRTVKALLPVHILGNAVHMNSLMNLAEAYNLTIIEDASESLGVEYDNQHTGTFGRYGALSFNGNKLITTGGGGMLLTQDSQKSERARHLTTQAKTDSVEYIHDEVGYNYRLTNVQAAMGCAQLENVDQYIKKKKTISDRYNEAFREQPGIEPIRESKLTDGTFWMYTILVDESQYGMNRKQLMDKLSENNIQTRPLWEPLHMSEVHSDCFSKDCSNAERFRERAVSLPCSVNLSSSDQERVIQAIKKHSLS